MAEIDHVAINVHFRVDRAEMALRDLGFHVTERGHHSLGSINHLMVFDNDYLELVGLPAETMQKTPRRPEIAETCAGINGLVFKASSTNDVFARLQELGMAGDPPKSFSRPVELANGTIDALFRTVKVRSDVFPGYRVYFCEHHTPEVVWRSEWQDHKNGATSIAEFVIVSEDNVRVAQDFANILSIDAVNSGGVSAIKLDGALLSILSPAAYQKRYGSLASSTVERPFMFGAVVIRTTDLAAARQFASDAKLRSAGNGDRLVICEPSLDAVIEFVSLL